MNTITVLNLFNDKVEDNLTSCTQVDIALNALFHSEVILGSIKSYIEKSGDEFINDRTGANFHKSFRCWNVVSDEKLSHALWVLIGESDLFWKTIKEAGNPSDSIIKINLSDPSVSESSPDNPHYS